MKKLRINGIELMITLSLILTVCLVGHSVQATPIPVSYSHLSLNPSTINLKTNTSESIQALVIETRGPHTQIKEITHDPHITWSVSNSTLATIQNGKITALGIPGTFVITALFAPPGGAPPMSATCIVTVTETPVIMDFDVGPGTEPFQTGVELTFTEMVQASDKSLFRFVWYVENQIYTNRSWINHTFPAPGRYVVRLVIQNPATGFEDSIAKNIDVISPEQTGALPTPTPIGPEIEPTVGPLGRYRNRFIETGAPENMIIKSSYWRGGTADWSEPIVFNGGRIGPVEHYILHVGDQADGFNTGYLVYVPQGGSQIRYTVFHFRWSDGAGQRPQGYVFYSGGLPDLFEDTVPDSLVFTFTASRYVEFQWQTVDGSICSARLSKYKKSDKLRYSGVQDLGCVDAPDPVTPVTNMSCENGDNVEGRCCCFLGTHTYLFDAQFIPSFAAVFDTGRGAGCRSTVTIDVQQPDDSWVTVWTGEVSSGKDGNPLNSISIPITINSVISGIRIADGCACCIDTSEIRF